MNAKRLLSLLLKIILTLIVVYFLGRLMVKHWTSIKDYDWDINIPYLVLSLICAQGALFIFAMAWRMIIRSFGYSVTPAEGFKISYLSNLGRYVPGKVWQFVGILYLTRKKGIAPEPAGASFVIYQVFTIPAAFLAFVLAGQVQPAILVDQVRLLGQTSSYVIMGGMLAFSALLVLYPDPFLRIVNAALARFSRPPIAFKLDKSIALQVFIGYFFGWAVYGLAFWLFLLSVIPEVSPGLVASIGIFAASYQIGYLAIFAPGGFGPRELVMQALLIPFAGPIAAAVAIIARLWSICLELIAALIALRIKM